MINQRIVLSKETDAYMDTYILSPSDQLQIGVRRPAVLVCPGGAYVRTSDQEAEQVALRFNTLGFHSAVVRYSCEKNALWPNPLKELAAAIRTFRENAEAWFVRPDKIAICGFSAGGHLCSMMSTCYAQAAEELGVSADSVRPDAAILGYPLIDLTVEMPKSDLGPYTIGEVDPAHPELSVTPIYKNLLCKVGEKYMLDFSWEMFQSLFGTMHPTDAQKEALCANRYVDENTCTAFVWNTASDELVPAINALEYVNAMVEKGVPCEYHMFSDGPHGLSLADETVAVNESMVNPDVSKWFELCKAWLKRIGFELAQR